MQRIQAHSHARERATHLVEEKGGFIRTSDALRMGIHPRVLYALRDSGVLEQISRGVFHLSAHEASSHPDLTVIAMRCPRAVICLLSALAFHGITTQVPHAVSIALEKGAESPRIEHPPISVHRFSTECLSAGIEHHIIDGVAVQIYGIEKTLADCFKFRNKIGMDVALEALKLYRTRNPLRLDTLMEYARICRVEKVMNPYIEALL